MTWEQMSQFEQDCWAVEKVLGWPFLEENRLYRAYRDGNDDERTVVIDDSHRVLYRQAWSVTRAECDLQVMQAYFERCEWASEDEHRFTSMIDGILYQRHWTDREFEPIQIGLTHRWMRHYVPGDYAHAAYLAMGEGNGQQA